MPIFPQLYPIIIVENPFAVLFVRRDSGNVRLLDVND